LLQKISELFLLVLRSMLAAPTAQPSASKPWELGSFRGSHLYTASNKCIRIWVLVENFVHYFMRKPSKICFEGLVDRNIQGLQDWSGSWREKHHLYSMSSRSPPNIASMMTEISFPTCLRHRVLPK
jgi:hypothetical protein